MLQVIIPAYNASRFIAQTLESVLAQGCVDDILVLDNASTDDTASIALSYSDRGVRCMSSTDNIGAIGNHNRALELADGEFVKLLSADDVLLPGILRKQLNAFVAHPKVGIVTCNCLVTDQQLTPLSETLYLPGYQTGPQAINRCAVRVANLVGAPSNTMLRRCHVGTVRFDPSLKWLGDLDFACKVLRNCDYFNIDEVGFLYRRHAGTDSLLACPPATRLHDEVAFVRSHGGGLQGLARVWVRQARIRMLRAAGDRKGARS